MPHNNPRLVKRRTRQIAPRLVSGEKRESIGHGLPPHIKAGIRMIAAKEGRSLSWVLENVIIDYFGLRRPEYVGGREERSPKLRRVK